MIQNVKSLKEFKEWIKESFREVAFLSKRRIKGKKLEVEGKLLDGTPFFFYVEGE
jgi:hypothetical protein